MRRFEELFKSLEEIRLNKIPVSLRSSEKTKSITHYVFYHNDELLKKTKPKNPPDNMFFVNLNSLPLPEGLRIKELTEEQNRAVFSEYLGILSIKPKSEMVGLFTYSIPLKFSKEHVEKGALKSIFLPEIKFEYLQDKEFSKSILYGAEFSPYNGNNNTDLIKEIDASQFHINPVDNGFSGPFKGTIIVERKIFLQFQEWFFEATKHLIKERGWRCGLPPGAFNNNLKYYDTGPKSKFNDDFIRGFGHIQERLMAYYFGRIFSEKKRVKLGDFLKSPSFSLIVQYFIPPDKTRQKELDYCLKKNCASPFIKKIFLLSEKECKGDLFENEKIEQIVAGGRLKYSTAFNFANKHPGEFFVLSNADIYFDETLGKTKEYDFDNLFLALSRYNCFGGGKEQLIIGPPKYNEKNVQSDYDEQGGFVEWGSQDSWIFRSPVSSDLIKNCDFEIGRLHCDSHVARVIKYSGYEILNPCCSIITRHVHGVLPGTTGRNLQERGEKAINGPKYPINPDGSSLPAKRTWVGGTDPKGKIKLYSIYTPSHEVFLEKFFLPSLKDDYFLVLEKYEQECHSGVFQSEGWMDTMKKKVELIIRAIKENQGQVFIHSDVDVQFFGKTKDVILQAISGNDIVFQKDMPEALDNDFEGHYCAGFFVCRGNEKTLKLFEDILSEIPKTKLNDQLILNKLIRNNKYKIAASCLPDSFWGPGTYYGKNVDHLGGYHWEDGDELLFPEEILMHHANWTRGIENKKRQLEYVKKRVFEKRVYC